jgi:hypothetical protein
MYDSSLKNSTQEMLGENMRKRCEYLSDCGSIGLLNQQGRTGPPFYTNLILFPGVQ